MVLLLKGLKFNLRYGAAIDVATCISEMIIVAKKDTKLHKINGCCMKQLRQLCSSFLTLAASVLVQR